MTKPPRPLIQPPTENRRLCAAGGTSLAGWRAIAPSTVLPNNDAKKLCGSAQHLSQALKIAYLLLRQPFWEALPHIRKALGYHLQIVSKNDADIFATLPGAVNNTPSPYSSFIYRCRKILLPTNMLKKKYPSQHAFKETKPKTSMA